VVSSGSRKLTHYQAASGLGNALLSIQSRIEEERGAVPNEQPHLLPGVRWLTRGEILRNRKEVRTRSWTGKI